MAATPQSILTMLLALTALFLLPGCVTEETTTTTLPDSSSTTTTTTTTTTTAAAVDVNQQLEECRKLNSWTQTNDCIKDLAVKNRDATLCSRIMQNPKMPLTTMWSLTMYNTAKSSCYIQIAVATLDETLCGEAENYYVMGGRSDQDCYMTIAAAKGNAAICELMRYDEEKAKCIELITSSASRGENARTCVDSDGVDENTKGYVLTWRGVKNEDACIYDGRLMEYTCTEDSYSISVSAPEFIECVGGVCEDGRCVKSS